MPIKTTSEQRQIFCERHASGATYAEIGQVYGLSRECVRYWCRRQSQGGRSHLTRKPVRKGLLSHFAPVVRYSILRLRLEHQRWGPMRLRYHLQKRPGTATKRLPSSRQIGRYLNQWPRFRRQRKQSVPKQKRCSPATHVHQRWQIDFKLGIPLSNGALVNLHTVYDPVGAVCITARVTAAGQEGRKARRVTVDEAQATLRSGFTRWNTVPEEVQTDGEALFVGNPQEQFPSRFTLWLVGLGIKHLIIRPGKPTDNAEVERCHRTLNAYTLVGHEDCSVSTLQTILDQDWYALAFELPSHAFGCEGRAPVLAHPDLLSHPHPFQAHLELALFDLQRMDIYLAQFTWRRTVGKSGQVSLGGQHHYYSIGRTYAHQDVSIRFSVLDRSFVFFLDGQPHHEIARRPARDLSVWDITGLRPTDPDFVPQQLPLDLVFAKE